MSLIAVTVLTATLVQVYGFTEFVSLVPNGARVQNPCPGGGIWTAIGHNSLVGGGPRNAFGTAFLATRAWTRALCLADSDGDGRSNGVELGDPLCQWTPGSPQLRAPSGHPGICEPVGSAQCSDRVCGWRGRGGAEREVSSREESEQEGHKEVGRERHGWERERHEGSERERHKAWGRERHEAWGREKHKESEREIHEDEESFEIHHDSARFERRHSAGYND